MSYEQTAQLLVEKLGGVENIANVKHCMTRVRFILKDDSKADVAAIEKDKNVLKVMQGAGQYQCVVGADKVDEITDEVCKITGLSAESVEDDAAAAEDGAQKKSIFDTILDYVVSIFIPIMPMFIGGGIIKGLLTMAVNLGWLDSSSGFYQVFYAVSDAFLFFMPMIVSFLAAKKFKCNEVIAEGLACAMFYPQLNSAMVEGIDFLGLAIAKPSEFGSGFYYANNVFAPILTVALLAFVEHWLKKNIKNKNLQVVLVPFLSLCVVTPFAFLVFGPISSYVGDGICAVYQAIFDFNEVLGGFVLGGIWQICILFGVHWAFVPMIIQLQTTTGVSQFDAVACVGTLCMEFLPLFVAMKTKDEELKTEYISIFTGCMLGTVVEPALYGVALRFKKLFVIGCLGGGIGGALAAFLGAYSTASGLNIYTFPMFFDCGLWRILVPTAIALVFTAIATWTVGYSDKDLEAERAEA